MREQSARTAPVSELFNPNAVLVPIPKLPAATSRPSVWVARRLALAMHAAGWGESVWAGLIRTAVVDQSSLAWTWCRPTVQQHFISLAVRVPAAAPTEIVLVDDVITKGRTLLAAALRLHVAFPHASIRAFALVRTLGFVAEVRRVFDPCRGEIVWDGRDASRNP